jgi:tetratricopeptide (TPR) repeat protein
MAREAAERALALDPGSADAHVAMGFYHYHAHKDYEPALREFEAAAAIRPDDPDMIFGAALVLRRQGKWEESTRTLERAISLDPRDEQALVDLGSNYLEMGRYEEALSVLERARTIRPDLPWATFYQVTVHWVGGDLDEARKTLERAPPGDQESQDWFWVMQSIYEHDFDAAARYLDACRTEWFKLGSVVRPRELLQAWVAELRGDEAGARRLYEAARLRMEGEVASGSIPGVRLHSSLGIAYAGLGRREDALREGRRSAEEDYPMTRDAVWGDMNLRDLAWIQTMVGDTDGAFDTLETLIQVPQEQVTEALARVDPRWDVLRDAPRWSVLMDQLSRGREPGAGKKPE